jgi:hypothetical protein
VYTSDFSAGVDGWTAIEVTQAGNIDGVSDGVTSKDDCLRLTKSGATGLSGTFRTGLFTIGGTGRIKISVYVPSGQTNINGFQVTETVTSNTIFDGDLINGQWVDVNLKRSAITSNGITVRARTGSSSTIPSGAAGELVYVHGVETVRTGLTSELLASNAQSDTGQIFDTSGNKNHALLPASGATIVGRPVSQTREVRWTNTWAGTNELQYIGGVNQAILPANAYIESIIGTVSGATPHDIIIGDGSDTDRYVTITTGLAAGTTNFALAARTTDGTNLKLTVDPDTNATMSIAWVIRYSVLE